MLGWRLNHILSTYLSRARNFQHSRRRRRWSLSSAALQERSDSLEFGSHPRSTNNPVAGIFAGCKPVRRLYRVARLEYLIEITTFLSLSLSRSVVHMNHFKKDEKYFFYLMLQRIFELFMFLTAPSFVRPVRTIDAPVAEVESRKARAIAASQIPLLAFTVFQ